MAISSASPGPQTVYFGTWASGELWTRMQRRLTVLNKENNTSFVLQSVSDIFNTSLRSTGFGTGIIFNSIGRCELVSTVQELETAYSKCIVPKTFSGLFRNRKRDWERAIILVESVAYYMRDVRVGLRYQRTLVDLQCAILPQVEKARIFEAKYCLSQTVRKILREEETPLPTNYLVEELVPKHRWPRYVGERLDRDPVPLKPGVAKSFLEAVSQELYFTYDRLVKEFGVVDEAFRFRILGDLLAKGVPLVPGVSMADASPLAEMLAREFWTRFSLVAALQRMEGDWSNSFKLVLEKGWVEERKGDLSSNVRSWQKDVKGQLLRYPTSPLLLIKHCFEKGFSWHSRSDTEVRITHLVLDEKGETVLARYYSKLMQRYLTFPEFSEEILFKLQEAEELEETFSRRRCQFDYIVNYERLSEKINEGVFPRLTFTRGHFEWSYACKYGSLGTQNLAEAETMYARIQPFLTAVQENGIPLGSDIGAEDDVDGEVYCVCLQEGVLVEYSYKMGYIFQKELDLNTSIETLKGRQFDLVCEELAFQGCGIPGVSYRESFKQASCSSRFVTKNLSRHSISICSYLGRGVRVLSTLRDPSMGRIQNEIRRLFEHASDTI